MGEGSSWRERWGVGNGARRGARGGTPGLEMPAWEGPENCLVDFLDTPPRGH